MGTVPISTSTTSFSPSEASNVIGVAVENMYLLVHRASDTAMTSTAASPSKTNAAERVRGNENGLGAMTIVCCLALALIALLRG